METESWWATTTSSGSTAPKPTVSFDDQQRGGLTNISLHWWCLMSDTTKQLKWCSCTTTSWQRPKQWASIGDHNIFGVSNIYGIPSSYHIPKPTVTFSLVCPTLQVGNHLPSRRHALCKSCQQRLMMKELITVKTDTIRPLLFDQFGGRNHKRKAVISKLWVRGKIAVQYKEQMTRFLFAK